MGEKMSKHIDIELEELMKQYNDIRKKLQENISEILEYVKFYETDKLILPEDNKNKELVLD